MKAQVKDGQRKFYLRQQLRAIQDELDEDGGEGDGATHVEELKARLEAMELPLDAKKVRLHMVNRMHHHISLRWGAQYICPDIVWHGAGREEGVATPSSYELFFSRIRACRTPFPLDVACSVLQLAR